MHEDSFDCLIGIPKVVFIEFLKILFLDIVDVVLDPNVGDCLLEVKGFRLKTEKFSLQDEIIDVRMDCQGLIDAIGGRGYIASDDWLLYIVKD